MCIKKLVHFGHVNYLYNHDFCVAFGSHVRKIREERGLSMRQFAVQLDIEYRQLARIERGEVNTTISTVYAIAEAFGITVSELFDFKVLKKNSK